MAQYEAVTSVYEAHGKKQRLRRPGTLVEVSDEDVERLLELGAIKKPGQNEADEPDDSGADEPVELPARPSNGAPKAEWVAYLQQLKAVTDPEMEEPLEVPADATRDQMIQIGDARVTAWNEG